MNDDRAELVRLLPDPAQRQPLPPERHDALRTRFLHDIDTPVAAPRRRVRRWVILVPAVSAALVIALWASAALTLGVGRFWAGHTDAGALLDRIALAAAVEADIPPADQVRDDQYEFVETYGGYLGYNTEVGPNGANVTTAVPFTPSRRRIWKSVDGSRPGLVRQGDDDPAELSGAGPAYLNNPTFRYLTTLPTNPDALLAKIYIETWGAGPGPRQEAFTTIGDLMRESIVPPKLAEALYRAAARIPGITVVDDAVDALGRHGVAIARVDAGERTEWIFDRDTLQFRGERSVALVPGDWGPAGTVLASTAIVARAFVDAPGRLPG